MPKTFHFKTTFDTKVVLQDQDLADLQEILDAVDSGTSQAHLDDQKRTGKGLPLDQRIALVARATLRNGVAELLAEECPEGYSFSPAKVTQVVIQRIDKAANKCTGCEYGCPDCSCF